MGDPISDAEFDPRVHTPRPKDWEFPKRPYYAPPPPVESPVFSVAQLNQLGDEFTKSAQEAETEKINPQVMQKIIEMLERKTQVPMGLESGAVDPSYPFMKMAVGGGGAKIAQGLLTQAIRTAIEAQQPLTQGPGMQTMEGSGMYTAAPRNARVRQFDRAMYDTETRLGMQHNVNRQPYNPAGSNKPRPLSPGEIQNMWNRLNPNNQMIGTTRVNQVRDLERPFFQPKPPYSMEAYGSNPAWLNLWPRHQ